MLVPRVSRIVRAPSWVRTLCSSAGVVEAVKAVKEVEAVGMPRLEALRASDPHHDVQRFLGPAFKDTFGRQHTYLRISLTEKCNLRCQYCMPENGVPLQEAEKIMTTEEIVRIARLFVSQGVDKIRLTGGEPLLRKDIIELCQELTDLGLTSLGISTNAIALRRKLPLLRGAGVTHVNISLDTLVPAKFQFLTRRKGCEHVLRAIDEALEHDFETVKLNCVVMKNLNEDEIVDFVAMTEHKALDIRFIEYMPFDSNSWSDAKFLSYADMLEIIRERYPTFEKLIDGEHDTSKGWRVPGFSGTVGFITSMSDNFCAGCNRLRLTADGNLKVCLFGNDEVSLRDMIRAGATDEELIQVVGGAIGNKHAMLGGNEDMYELAEGENRPMILIGG